MVSPTLLPDLLVNEARALHARLAHVKPFALQEAMVPAAALSPLAQSAIDGFLINERRKLALDIQEFIQKILSGRVLDLSPVLLQKRYTLLRLKFNAVLTKVDLFADVITQRSESGTGVWLSGLDTLAADALALPDFYQAPPVICYLDRGMGARYPAGTHSSSRWRLKSGSHYPCAQGKDGRQRYCIIAGA